MRVYIQDNFQPDDRLAVVCKSDRWHQSFVSVNELLGMEARLRQENNRGAEIYVSMNALKPEARSRTKENIAAVRHIYLDIDENGHEALARIHSDAPMPSYILNTSKDKFQVIWKTAGFTNNEDAEALLRAMAARYGTDRAVVDVSRVLRIPGFFNRKYAEPFMVTAEKLSDRVYRPEDFIIDRQYGHIHAAKLQPVHSFKIKQIDDSPSGHDWAEVCKRIERGENPNCVRDWLTNERYDKPNPRYYAELTVSRAIAHISMNNAIKPKENQFSKNEVTNMGKHFITGNAYAVKDKLKEFGFRWDGEKKQWYHNDKAIAEKIQALVPEKYRIGTAPKELTDTLKKMGAKWDEKGWYHDDPDKAKEAHREILKAEPRYYITGATETVKDKLKELGCRWDDAVKQWYHTDPEKAKTIQVMVPEKHYIGIAPKELSETLKGMGAKWDEKGWYHTNAAAAETAHKLIIAKEPRYYITGATEAVKGKLKELGCRWDAYSKLWYHTDKATAEKAQTLIPDKHYIGFVPKGMSETLKTMGAKWDGMGWYHTDPNKAKEAQQKILEAEPRYYITGDSLSVKEKLKELGCRWDVEKKQWYHTDPNKAKQAQAVIDAAPEKAKQNYKDGKHYIPDAPTFGTKELTDLGCEYDEDTDQWYHTDFGKAQEAAKSLQERAQSREAEIASSTAKQFACEF